MIEAYSFGSMVIAGKRYTRDIIVFPERTVNGWWRKEGHEVCLDDLKALLICESKPEIIVIGTGYNGLVKVLHEVGDFLKTHGIELIAQPTPEAYQTFNKLLKSNKRVAGAFHLTC